MTTGIVSGSLLGLYGNSIDGLGASLLGRNSQSDRVYFNSATGNLVVQSQDEYLASFGLDLGLVRTYNSLGVIDGDNNDGWRIGVYRRLHSRTGTANNEPSAITKVYGDGTEAIFVYDASRGLYVSAVGDGAHDTLSFSTTTNEWTFSDGNSLSTETYDVDGRLARLVDEAGNAKIFTYFGSLITQIADAQGQVVYLDYIGTNLAQVRVLSEGREEIRTRYEYDTLSRLQYVRVDLSPEDRSIADGRVYTTSYAYEGSSNRIASIAQSDGTSVAFTYELSAGQYRLKTYTDGEGRRSTLTYTGATIGTQAIANANMSMLSTTEQTATPLPLITSQLTTPTAGWAVASLFETGTPAASDPKVAFDANGNGFAIWRQQGDLWVRRYDRVTNIWSPQTQLDVGTATSNTTYTPALAVDAGGNAVAIWAQSVGGVVSAYVSRYTASTGQWTLPATLVENTANAVTNTSDTTVASIRGNQMAVGWLQSDGTNTNLYVARFNGTTWSAAQAVDASSNTNAPAQATLSVDAQGNVIALWQQSDGTTNNIYFNRYSVSSGTWSGATLFETSGSATSEPEFAFDANGNGFAIFRQGNDLIVRRYTGANNSWANPTPLDVRNNAVNATALAFDAQGNAIAAWVQTDGSATSTYVSRYTASTGLWSTAIPIDGTDTLAVASAGLVVGINNGVAAVGWLKTDGTRNNFYVSRFVNNAWTTPDPVDANDNAAAQTTLTVDDQGNVIVLWQQSNGANSIYLNRYASGASYYSVPASANWNSIAQTLYGNSALGSELQTRYGDPLFTGRQLSGLPASLSVPGSVTNVAPYYTVVAGDTWTTITQKVYGTTNAAAVAMLQAALGNRALEFGAHLPMPSSFPYGTGTPSMVTRVDVQTDLGLVSSYLTDSNGRLERILAPSVGGVRLETRYGYDPATGNLTSITEDPTGLNRITTLEYDTRGNLQQMRDAGGNTVTRIYSGNLLATETRYTVADPDGGGPGQPGGALTTRYAYDSSNRLRYLISADGRVTEHRYNPDGTRAATLNYGGGLYDVSALLPTTQLSETQLNDWIASQDRTKLERTEYGYDFRGKLSALKTFGATDSATGAGIASTLSTTRFVYDQRGQLIKTIDARGEATSEDPDDYVTSYIFDGYGRLNRTVQWLATGPVMTETQYDDPNRRTITTFANGLVTTSDFNGAGDLLSVVNTGPGLSAPSTVYKYDRDGRLRYVTNPTGQRQHILYDDAGRKIGEVDADGTLTEFIYNRASQLIKTIQYADPLTSASVASLVDQITGNPTSVTLATLRDSLASVPGRNSAQDMITRVVFDAAGRLVYAIDEVGAVTKTVYDGANRVVEVVQYATPFSIPRATDDMLPAAITVSESADDRRTRNFYDRDGNVIGMLDAEGFLVKNTYDNAGRLTTQKSYANPTPVGSRLTGTLTELTPTEDNSTADDPEQDSTTYFYYDGKGRRVGALNAEGYFTETRFDVAGNVDRVIRYATDPLAYATFDSLISQVAGAPTRTTAFQYDGMGRLWRETNFEGTITEFAYNGVGNVLSVTRALGTTEERKTQAKYDALGRVTDELSAEGSAQIALGMSVATAWSLYALHHEYDDAGRRKSTTDQNGFRTLFFYDVDGRLTHIVNAEGEVSETKFDARGRATQAIRYDRPISVSGLSGGLVNSTLTDLIISTPDRDAVTTFSFSYETYGGKITTTTVEGAQTVSQLDAFGQEFRRTEKIDDIVAPREHSYRYDHRGLLLETRWEPAGINRKQTNEYDAFGRLSKTYDQDNNAYRTEYDRLGRIIATFDPLNNKRTTSYDAFDRLYKTRDAFQGVANETTFQYFDAERRTVITMPENISITQIHNRHGQMLTVTDAIGNVTTYQYDVNGNIDTISDSLSAGDGRPLEDRTYDRAGRLTDTVDARGVNTHFAYDAASRLLTRTVDSGGLALQTSYLYDDQGRVTDITDANGVLTKKEYDRDGRVRFVTVDPYGPNRSKTEYKYDLIGNTTTVIEGLESLRPETVPLTVKYVFDRLGRRIEETVDPGAGKLNLTTLYKYDANGNMTRRIDAENASTWYVYDGSGRLRFTVDALGGVTETTYDKESRAISTRRYATEQAGYASFGEVVTLGQITVGQTANDRLEQSVYDSAGREIYTISAIGGVTRKDYDANGSITRMTRYSRPVALQTYLTIQNVTDALTAAGNAAATQGDDQVSEVIYDLRNRATHLVDDSGAVIRNEYDATGNLTVTTSYTTRWDRSVPIATFIANNAGVAGNRVTRTWYDGSGRAVFTLDPEGYLTETRYDDLGRITRDIVYVTKPSGITSSTPLQDVRNHAVVTNLDVTIDQVTKTEYDSAGRVSKVTDATGYFESYEYDGVGNRTRLTDKKGAIWSYEYDASRRLMFQRSPNVAVTTVDVLGSGLTANINNSMSIVTYIQYDLLGNVWKRTEAYGTTQARTTEYDYDALGRLTKTILPTVNIYSEPAGDENTVGSAVTRTERELNPTTEIEYDLLGNAFRSKDVAGSLTFVVRDNARRLRYEVDAENYVTRRTYDAFGNEIEMRRYASALRSALPTTGTISISDIETTRLVIDDAVDRVITTKYDGLNRVTEVKRPRVDVYETAADPINNAQFQASPTTLTEYNAFGQAIRKRELVNPNTSKYNDTFFYYDNRGLKTAEVDAMGYLTTYKYDETGDLKEQREYSRVMAAAAWSISGYTPVETTRALFPTVPAAGYDRITTFDYDRMNRRTGQTLVDIDYADINGASQHGDQTTTYGFDAAGNQTRVTASTGSTYTYYDALGRAIAIAEPRRDIDGTLNANGTERTVEFTPLTELKRDAFGSLVAKIERANDAGVIDPLLTTPPSVAASGDDRTTLMRVDRHSNIVQTQDASNANRHISYNARGQVAKEWQQVRDAAGQIDTLVTIHKYDRVGNEIEVIEPQWVRGSNVTITGTTTAHIVQWWGGPDGNWYYEWQGTNSVSVSYASVGAASVRVRVEYTQEVPWDGHPGVYLSPVLTNAATGTTVSWTDSPAAFLEAAPGGLWSVERVQVLGQDASGSYTVVLREIEIPTRPTSIVRTQAHYNAFGEVDRKGIDGTWSEFVEHDQAGRIWRSNAGDGVHKIFMYNLAGNATLEIRSQQQDLATRTVAQALALPASEQMRSETRYDALGRVIGRRLPSFETPGGLEPIGVPVNIGQVLGPNNSRAVYQYWDYGPGDQRGPEYIFNPMATLEEGGGYYLDANGNYVVDSSHRIVTLPRLYWQPPSTPGIGWRFEYRVAGSTGDYIDIPITYVENGLGVNVNGLANPNNTLFEYRIQYRRLPENQLFAQSTGTFRVDGTTTITVGISQPPADTASEVPQLSITNSNQTLSWAAPADTSVTAVIKLKSTQPNSTEYTYNVPRVTGGLFLVTPPILANADTYTYDIIYSRGGTEIAHKTGQLRSTGTGPVRTVTNSVPPLNEQAFSTDEIQIASVTGTGASPVSARVVSSAVQYQDEYGPNGTYYHFSGTNRIDFAWNSLGSGRTMVKVTYSAHHSSYVQAESTQDLIYSAGVTSGTSQWPDGPAEWNYPSYPGGVGQVTRIQLYTESYAGAGDWMLRVDQSNPPVTSGAASLSWAWPGEDLSPTLEIRVNQSGSYVTVPQSRWTLSGEEYNVDISAYGAGTHDYRIRYYRGGRIISEQTGTAAVSNGSQTIVTTATVTPGTTPQTPEGVSTVNAVSPPTTAIATPGTPPSAAEGVATVDSVSTATSATATAGTPPSAAEGVATVNSVSTATSATATPGTPPLTPEAVGTVIGVSATSPATLNSFESSTFSSWQDDENYFTWNWSGWTGVNVSYASIGSVAFKVQLDFETNPGDGNPPVETRNATSGVFTNMPTGVNWRWYEQNGPSSYPIVPAGGIGRVLRVRIMGQDGSGQYTVVLRDTAGPSGSTGLSWPAPSASYPTTRFWYRSSGGSWIERTVTRSGTCSVDFNGLGLSGAYEYWIGHYRSGESFAASYATGTFTVSGATVTRNSQTNGSEQPTWITSSNSGSNVTWSRAASGLNVYFDYWNGSSWVPRTPTTSDGTAYRADMTGLNGNYSYRIRYATSPAALPAAEGIGTVNVVAPTSGPGLRWSAPGTSFAATHFFYRRNPTDAWIQRTVTPGSGFLNVDFFNLGLSGQYYYLIGYQRSGEAFYASTATGQFSVSGTTATRDSQTNGTETPTWITSSNSGSNVTWSRAASGLNVYFDYWNGSSWVPRTPTTSDGTAYRADMTGLNGNYSYRIRYATSPAAQPAAEGIGTVNVVAPTSGPGLRWSAPGTSFAATHFFYRRNPTDAWIQRTVTPGSGFLNVDFFNLGLSGQYYYLIGYQRSGEAFYASTATGQFSVSGTTATRDSQTNGTETPTWITSSNSGSNVTWSRAASGLNVYFDYWNGSSWVPRTPTTSDGTAYRADMTGLNGNYSYRIRYATSPAALPAAEGIGTVNVSSAQGATLNSFESSTFSSWQDDENYFTWNWSGWTGVNVSYASIGSVAFKVQLDFETNPGDGNPPVETRNFWSGVYTNMPTGVNWRWYEQNGPSSYPIVPAGGIGRVLRVRIMGQDGSGQYTVVLRDTAAPASGAGLSWNTPIDTSYTTRRFWYSADNGATWIEREVKPNGAILSVDLGSGFSNSITYRYKIGHQRTGENFYAAMATGSFTVNGTSVTLVGGQTNSSEFPAWIPVSHNGSNVTWQAAANGATVTFEYHDGANWVPRGWSSSDNTTFNVNMSGLAGRFNYRVRYTSGGLIIREANGSVLATPAPSGPPPGVTVTQLTNPVMPTARITPLSISGDRLNWNYHAEPGTGNRVIVRYYFDNQYGTVYEHPATNDSGDNWSTTFPELAPPGIALGQHTINYTVLYLRNGQSDPYAKAEGRANVTLSNPTVYATIYVDSQTPVYPSGVQQVAAPTHSSGNLISWTTPSSGGTPTFEYWVGSNGTHTPLTVTPISGGSRVDLTSVPGANPGTTYEYEIIYRTGSAINARARGQFTLTRAQTITNLEETDTTASTQTAVPTRPSVSQLVDRWGNVISVTDALQKLTTYSYNRFNQRTVTSLPSVAVVSTVNDAIVTTPSATPTSYNYYDQLGRLIATRDANGNLTKATLNAAGETLAETDALNNSERYRLDTWGNRVERVDELGYRTRNRYDTVDRLTHVAREIVAGGFTSANANDFTALNGDAVAIDVYGYDESGRRTSETNGENETTRYFYDLLGNVIKRVTPMNRVAEYRYDALGRKVHEKDANGSYASWTYDYFGRIRNSTSLYDPVKDDGGVVTTYFYNENAGLLQEQTSDQGQDIEYHYDAAGRVNHIQDDGVNRDTYYDYDAAGRHVRERTVINDRTHQDLRISYDAAGRTSGLSDSRYTLSYSYDAQGNRTRINAVYFDHQQVERTQDLWYSYDFMNRVLVGQGINDNGTVRINSSQGVDLSYNAASQRTRMETYGPMLAYSDIEFWDTASGSGIWRSFPEFRYETDRYYEIYSYDGMGRLDTTHRSGVYRYGREGAPVEESTSEWLIDDRKYDKASREIEDRSSTVEGTQLLERVRASQYDDDGRLQLQTTSRLGYQNRIQDETAVSYEYDEVGNLSRYYVTSYNLNADHSWKQTATFTNTYRLGGSAYQQHEQTLETSVPNPPGPIGGRTTQVYDANNELIAIIDQNTQSKNRYLANGVTGQPITVIQGSYGTRTDADDEFGYALARWDNQVRAQHFFFANGQSVGSFGQLQDANGRFKANFDVNFTPISDGYPATVPPQTVVQPGETLRMIAARVLGDPNLWYILADENGLTDPDAVQEEGTSIRIPNRVISLPNSANSFKPFDIRDAIGDMTPTQLPPPMPQAKGCGPLAMLIVMVVAIVVTVLSSGAAAGAMGGTITQTTAAGVTTIVPASSVSAWSAGLAALSGGVGSVGVGMAAAAVGGAVGSIAGQLAGMALGVQDKFSWGAVAAGALGSAATAGIGSLGNGGIAGMLLDKPGRIATAVVNGMAGNVINQGINVLTGLQEKFNWSQVAAAAAGGLINGAFGNSSHLGRQMLVRGLADGVGSELTGGEFGDGFAAGAVGALSERASYLVGNKFTGDSRGGFAHGMAHFFVQGATEAALAYTQGARGDAVGRAFAAGGLGGFASTVMADTFQRWSGGNEKSFTYIAGQVGRIAGAGLGMEGAGSSAAIRESSFNFLPHKVEEIRQKARQIFDSGDGDRVEAAGVLRQLDYIDQHSDELLIRWREDPTSLSAEEKNTLAGYLDVYGQLDGKAAFDRLMSKGPTPTYDFPYALPESSEYKQRIIEERKAQAQAESSWTWITGWRDTKPDEDLYMKAGSFLKGYAEFRGRAEVGMPALMALSGPLGTALRLVGFAAGSYQLGQGIGQVSSGNYSSGAANIGLGTLAIFGSAYFIRSMPGVLGAGSARAAFGFRAAPKSGFNFESQLTSEGEFTRLELLSKNRFDAAGEVVESKFSRSELSAKLGPDGNMHVDWYSTNSEGHNIGREMLSTAIETFGPKNVTSVSAQFGRTNLEVYKGYRGQGLSESQAAWGTPFGRAMRDLGFRSVDATRAPYNVVFEFGK